ncbi:ABC-F family ATP-binding cassette domain-containing protein [Anaeromyxobacter oryzae]|uniref:ABC transporter ATP-binding protein n=1 Tax=Anaeromyxobacter oryzae TaxID=2918170 RepID=A0ABM7WNV6_9BACT|nr:ABC-F family ATP-binding cassette domain-containing protein [Anaeromyxobacter oryzae]BDG01152.1 ABC transporter ATP-binding protein [Anaeromyxobacter oryzae]
MTLLHAADLRLSFGSRTIFDALTLTIEEGERVGLVGVNGSGKSSLMRILARASEPDRGEVQLRRGATVTYLPQEPAFPEGATVASELEVARAPLRAALDAHAALSARLESERDEAAHARLVADLAAVSERIEHLGGWDTSHEARRLLDRLGVKDWDRAVADLSGGTRKRVAIARALLTRPDLLLLDEPTNHLDADTVDWLEEELDAHRGALLLVTHDRYFLDDLVDRIVEITPGAGVTSFPGNYEAYLAQKLEAEELASVAQHKRERWIAQEVAWLRRGVEARRTKSKARIDRARRLMAERGFSAPKVAEIQVAAPPRLSQVVLEAHGLAKAFEGRTVLRGVDFTLQRGERVGIVGPNGVGKTTFLRVLLGELAPDAGEVVTGKRTKVAYYDQQRAKLDPEQTLYEAAGGSPPGKTGEDYIELSGRRVALRDYLDDLLFPPTVQRMQVKALSGGERNRLLLARLFLEGANVLVLDEPTNDLDLVTLNVLERLLLQFDGSVLLVTHDRYFLDKAATAILAFEGDGRAVRYPGNYETYRTLKEQAEAAARAEAQAAVRPERGARAAGAEPRGPSGSAAEPRARKPGKLSFKEQRELEGMEAAILDAEERKAALEAALGDPATYQKDGGAVAGMRAELEQVSGEVERLYARWQELEALRAGGP